MAREGVSAVTAAATLHHDARAGEVTVSSAAAAVVRSTQPQGSTPTASPDHV